MTAPALDVLGKDTLKQLPELPGRARLVLTPDSGPTDLANAIGALAPFLHACTNAGRPGPTRACGGP